MKRWHDETAKELATIKMNAGAADRMMIEKQVWGNENFFYSYIPFINQKFNDMNYGPR